MFRLLCKCSNQYAASEWSKHNFSGHNHTVFVIIVDVGAKSHFVQIHCCFHTFVQEVIGETLKFAFATDRILFIDTVVVIFDFVDQHNRNRFLLYIEDFIVCFTFEGLCDHFISDNDLKSKECIAAKVVDIHRP